MNTNNSKEKRLFFEQDYNEEINNIKQPHKVMVPNRIEGDRPERYVPSKVTNVPRGCQPQDSGWVEMRLEKSDMDCLWKYIENSKKENENINRRLAGNVSCSLEMNDTDNFFIRVIDPLCGYYHKLFGVTPNVTSTASMHPLTMNSMWVNFQKKHEFNPIHNHHGVFSFVIFMKIPTDFSDQRNLSIASHANSDAISNFSFSYTDIFGKIRSHPMYMSPEYEGIILLFPSALMHQVYPFYESDETRITISGNVVLDTKVFVNEETNTLERFDIKDTRIANGVGLDTPERFDNDKIKKPNGQSSFGNLNEGIDSPQERSLFSGLQ